MPQNNNSMIVNTFVRVLDMDAIPKNLSTLSNKELLICFEKSIEDTVCVINGKIAPKPFPAFVKPTSIFAATHNELMRRGYTRDEIGKIRSIISAEKDFFKPFFTRVPQYKKFERLVGKIFKAFYPAADIKLNDVKVDLSNTERELDVSIRMGNQFLLIECKDYSKKVAIDRVESFITKCKDLSVDLGIMVSSSGYQSGSLNKAKLHNIKLLTLQEANKMDWSVWKTIKRKFAIIYPVPHMISFTPNLTPEEARSIFPSEDQDFLSIFRIKTEKQIIKFDVILGQATTNVAEQCIPLPCTINFPFEKKTYLMSENNSFMRNIEAVHIEFKTSRLIPQEKIIEMPVGPIYNLKDVLSGHEQKIDEFELPNI